MASKFQTNKNITLDYASTTNVAIIQRSENFEYQIDVAGILSIDGFVVVVGTVILLKNQTNATQNFILECTEIIDIGGGDSRYVFQVPEIGRYLHLKDIVYVETGTTQGGNSYFLDSPDETLTIGGSEMNWIIFNNAAVGSGSVNGVAPTTVNALTRWNDTTATEIKNSPIIVDDAGNVSNAIITNNTNTVAASILKAPTNNVVINTADAVADYVLKATSDSDATWQAIGTAPTTVNAIARWENTAATVIKNSNVTINDAGAFANATITDVSNDVAANSLRGSSVITSVDNNDPVTGSFLVAGGTFGYWVHITPFINYSFVINDVSTASLTPVSVGQIAYNEGILSLYFYQQLSNSSYVFYATIVDRDLEVEIYDVVAATVLDSTTITTTGIASITPSSFPAASTYLQLRIYKNLAGGTDPILNAAVANFAHNL